jgi:hypothetical protein
MPDAVPRDIGQAGLKFYLHGRLMKARNADADPWQEIHLDWWIGFIEPFNRCMRDEERRAQAKAKAKAKAQACAKAHPKALPKAHAKAQAKTKARAKAKAKAKAKANAKV